MSFDIAGKKWEQGYGNDEADSDHRTKRARGDEKASEEMK